MPRKTDRHHQQGDVSRQRILEAALEIAAERGYDGTSVALVTEKTGLPASSIYWHFKNKDSLLAEVLEFSYRNWREVGPTWKASVTQTPFEEQVHARFRDAAAAFSRKPEFWRLGLMLALEHRVKEPAARGRYIEIRQDTLARLTEWWSGLLEQEHPGTSPDVAITLARFHLAAMDGLFVGANANRGWDLDWLVDTVASGLAVAARRLTQVAS
ncbi:MULTISPECIES: TetR/AcrR family transcriptional regulator [unclassified Salinibacterium]|uniref:TetR/AcrR family transcriptional regulator n=1 Tax=unclassified Salinibacterium TaxID=2632331 RepID=UPI0014238441|nr:MULTISPECIES: TetR/AcrR family transcriptional regulator [unclassified Salinibacterium]